MQESPLKYALARADQSPVHALGGRQRMGSGLQRIHRAKQQNPAVLTCLPPPTSATLSPGPVPRWFLPQDRGAQLRNPISVCSLGSHRTLTPGQCPRLRPCEDKMPGAHSSQGASCVCWLRMMMRVGKPHSEQSEGDGITQNMNGSHLATLWDI